LPTLPEDLPYSPIRSTSFNTEDDALIIHQLADANLPNYLLPQTIHDEYDMITLGSQSCIPYLRDYVIEKTENFTNFGEMVEYNTENRTFIDFLDEFVMEAFDFADLSWFFARNDRLMGRHCWIQANRVNNGVNDMMGTDSDPAMSIMDSTVRSPMQSGEIPPGAGRGARSDSPGIAGRSANALPRLPGMFKDGSSSLLQMMDEFVKMGDHVVMGRQIEMQNAMLNLTLFAGWRQVVRIEATLRKHHGKVDAKRQQLVGVQHMFRNFATQLEAGLKQGQDTDRDFAAGPPPRKSRQHESRQHGSRQHGMRRDEASVSLPDINHSGSKGDDQRHSGRSGASGYPHA
jgi:hypothetical protein